jgi:hypothetical protein
MQLHTEICDQIKHTAYVFRIQKVMIWNIGMGTGYSESSRGVPQSLQAAARTVHQINNIFYILLISHINMQYEL